MKQTTKRLQADYAYHVTVETESHEYICHMATNNHAIAMFWLERFCEIYPNFYWIVHGIGKAEANNADCPAYDRVHFMRDRLLKGWAI